MNANLDAESIANLVWDVIIIGAGLAGTIAAQQLSASGVRTLLVEKKSFPREKVCGACLNASALATLRSAGLSGLINELGRIRLGALTLGHAKRSLHFTLPDGIALSRARLDAALVDAAVASGTTFLPETQALVGPVTLDMRRVLLEQSSRNVTAFARVVLVATGLGQARFEDVTAVCSQTMVRSRIGAGCAVDGFSDFYRTGTVFMAIGQGGYVGLVQVENGQLNVAAAYERSHVKQCGDPGSAAKQILAEAGFPPIPSLRNTTWRGTLPLTRKTSPIAGERFFLIGDATGYVEPFTGEGMAWALASGYAITPLIMRAVNCWTPSWPHAWISFHRRYIEHRQMLCCVLATMLRQPWRVHVVFKLASQAPRAAQFIIDRLNAPIAFPLPF